MGSLGWVGKLFKLKKVLIFMNKRGLVGIIALIIVGIVILGGSFFVYSSYRESSLEDFYKNANLETAQCLKSCSFEEVVIDPNKGIGSWGPEKTVEEVGGTGNAFEINENCKNQCISETTTKISNKFPTPTEPKNRDHYKQYSELVICMNMLKIDKQEITNCLNNFISKYSG